MRAKVFLLAGWLAFLEAGVGLGQIKRKQEKPSPPLVRMDLLRKKEGDIAVVKRDIFVPQSSVPAFASPAAPLPGVRSNLPEVKPVEEPQEEMSPSLRYMGYIQGGRKFLALILFENQAMAVEEGELIGQIWKVIRVEAGEIEVQGAAEKTYKFALEGERK